MTSEWSRRDWIDYGTYFLSDVSAVGSAVVCVVFGADWHIAFWAISSAFWTFLAAGWRERARKAGYFEGEKTT